jgi:hypothetical protein
LARQSFRIAQGDESGGSVGRGHFAVNFTTIAVTTDSIAIENSVPIP